MADENEKSTRPAENGDSEEKTPSGLKLIILPVAIIAAGVLVAFILVKSQKPPERAEAQPLAPLVEVDELAVRDIQMTVRGSGTVSPKVQVEIVPQVAGNIVYANRQFQPGGLIRAGEKILQIDPKDYELAVRQAEAVVADARVKLDLERAEAQVARSEWEQLHLGSEAPSPLVLRQPQIRQAEAMLQSAQAQLAKANLNLERTQLSLPLDAIVISEKVDLGQFVSVGQSVGVAYGMEAVEIEVPLEDEELAWFDIPGDLGSGHGRNRSSETTIADVKADFAGAEHTWTGYVRRTTGQVDKTSRLVPVVVEVPEPFRNSNSRPALVPGMFVQVVIEGKILKNAFAIPRHAVHNGNKVWLVQNGRLYIRGVDIVRTDKGFAYTVSGLDDGAQVVVSALDTVTDGMTVRTQSNTRVETARDSNRPELKGTD